MEPPKSRQRIGLVGCVKAKQSSPAPAALLYVSPLFRGRRDAVETNCDRWYILSAAHGLVAPEELLEPYDVTLTTMGSRQRRAWAHEVLGQLKAMLGSLEGHAFEIHAGAAYTDHGLIGGLEEAGASVEQPLRGLSLGQQLAYYAMSAEDRSSNPSRRTKERPRPSPPIPAIGSKYAPLHRQLAALAGSTVEYSFSEIEQLLGTDLPSSARRHRAWWANTKRAQSLAWLDAGWRVDHVNLTAARVRFLRGT